MQKELKVPKGNYNSFGKYKYRSCEDIVEAIKQIMPDGYALRLSDEMIMLGDRFYIRAQAELFGEAGMINAFGYARESLDKKGMDDSQITGTASSYARKYALNGLFAIDDTKDADTDEYKGGIKDGVLDDDARKQADDMFIEQLEASFNLCNSTNDINTLLTAKVKQSLGKLSKANPDAFSKLQKRKNELVEQFTKQEEELINKFNEA